MKNKTMDFIKCVVEHSDTFHSSLKNSALIEQAAFEAECADENFEAPDENDVEFNAKLMIFEDKDELVALLDVYKDYMEQQLGEKERFINRSISDEWEKIEKNVTTSQHNRNR